MYNQTHLAFLTNFAKSLRGRQQEVTLYSLNRNSPHTEHGKMNNVPSYTKIENYPIFNLQETDLSVVYNFDEGGYHTDGNTKMVTTIITDIFQVENGDIMIVKDYNESIAFIVETDEKNMKDVENGNIKNINLTSFDKPMEIIESRVEQTLSYNYEQNTLTDVIYKDKYEMHFSMDLSSLWVTYFKDLFTYKGITNFIDPINGTYLNGKLFSLIANSFEVLDNTTLDVINDSSRELILNNNFPDYDLEVDSVSTIHTLFTTMDWETLTNEERFENFLYYLYKMSEQSFTIDYEKNLIMEV